MFYFQQLLNRGLAGIDATSMLPAIVGISYAVLLIGFLTGLYHAALRGGDVQSLAVTAIKYLGVAMVLANWSSVFREVNGSFNQVAQSIAASSTAGDLFLNWFHQLGQQFSASGKASILPLVSGASAALISAILVIVAYLIYAVMVVLFAFFYVLYGCALYVLGPLVLALLPMAGIGRMAGNYAVNFMIWNAWGLLYAIFGSLITAILVTNATGQAGFMGFFSGPLDAFMLGLISIFYALALGLIPFVAKRLVSGDVGATAHDLVRAGAAAVGTALAAASGFGAAAGSAGGAGAAGAGSAGGGAASASGGAASSTPPPQPSIAGTIRSGMMSASNGTPPATPTSAAPPGSQSSGSSGSRASSGSGTGGGSQNGFRPVGVGQQVAFQAGRLAGRSLGNSTNGSDQKDETA